MCPDFPECSGKLSPQGVEHEGGREKGVVLDTAEVISGSGVDLGRSSRTHAGMGVKCR